VNVNICIYLVCVVYCNYLEVALCNIGILSVTYSSRVDIDSGKRETAFVSFNTLPLDK